MRKISIATVLLISAILFACKKNDFELRPEEKILNGQSVRNWKISSIVYNEDQSDLYDSLLFDCEKDNFFSFYDDNKYEEHDSDIVCKVDSATDVLEEGIWSVTTDDAYFDIHSSSTLDQKRYTIISISTSQLVMEDSVGIRFTLDAQ